MDDTEILPCSVQSCPRWSAAGCPFAYNCEDFDRRNQNMNDCIKRNDVLSAIKAEQALCGTLDYKAGILRAMEVVEKFPSADLLIASARSDCRSLIPAYAAIEKVLAERIRQMELWGERSDNHPFEWMSILGEEFGELCEAVNETFFKNGAHPECGGNEKIIKEAVHVAAVAVAIVESAMRSEK